MSIERLFNLPHDSLVLQELIAHIGHNLTFLRWIEGEEGQMHQPLGHLVSIHLRQFCIPFLGLFGVFATLLLCAQEAMNDANLQRVRKMLIPCWLNINIAKEKEISIP